MKLAVTFSESTTSFNSEFGEVHTVSDGGYESGYADGLAARTHETWTMTLVDGTVVEKDVALL